MIVAEAKANELKQSVNTSADWSRGVMKFCDGELEFSEHDFIRQDNVNRTIESGKIPLNTTKKRKVAQ